MLPSTLDYLILGGILAFLNGLIVACCEKLGRKIACVICVYMVTFIFAYPGWIDYAVSVGMLDYSSLLSLLQIEDAHLNCIIFGSKIKIPIYLVYSLTLALTSIVGLTIPLLKGGLLLALLSFISATSIALGFFIGTISATSLLQLELFGSSCLLVEIFVWWSQRTNKIIADKAKKFYDFIKMRGEATAEDLMREFHILNEREFSRVIQKMLNEHQIIANEREGKILFSVNSTQKSHT